MHDSWLDEELRRSLTRKPDHAVPDFASVMQVAEERNAIGRARYRLVAAFAVAASFAAVMMAQWPNGDKTVDDEFKIGVALLESTQWVAPSDVWLPQYQFDIYRDVPVFMGSTEAAEGTLL